MFYMPKMNQRLFKICVFLYLFSSEMDQTLYVILLVIGECVGYFIYIIVRRGVLAARGLM